MSSTHVSEDAQIVQRVLAGDRQEFGELVGRYLPMVHAFAYAHVGNHADAEDASQEAFLRAFQSLHKLRDRSRFGAWLVGIARHTCSGVRNSRRKQARLAEETRHAPSAVVPDMAQRDLRELVRRKIAELDEPSREVLLLYYFSGKKIHEVAAVLEISPDAAAKRIQRAREGLGEKLLNELYPTVQSERPEEERKAAILGLIMATPVPWASAPGTSGSPPRTPTPATVPAAPSTQLGPSGFFSRHRGWILFGSVALLVLVLGAGLLMLIKAQDKKPAAPPRNGRQVYTSPGGLKGAPSDEGKGSSSDNTGKGSVRKGK